MDDLGPWFSATVEHLKEKWQAHIPPALITFGGMMAMVFVAIFFMVTLMFGGGIVGALLADATGQDFWVALFGVGGMVIGYLSIFVAVLLLQPLMLGYMRFVLLLHRGEQPTLGEFKWPLRRLHRIIALMVVQMGLGMVAAMFCYFPVFIVMGGLFFAWPAMVDRDLGAIEAARVSWEMARPRLLQMVVLALIMMVASMVLSYIPVVGPVIVFAGWTTLQIVAYEDLRTRSADPLAV